MDSKKILVPIADGTEEMEVVIIADCLRRAGAEVVIASVGDLQITASRGIKIVADCLLADCADKVFDLIVLAGGLPGAEHFRDCEILINMLKEQKNAGRMYAAICASPAVVLAEHGLLDDKKATCYPSMVGKLPNGTVDERVVVDGNCITSQAPGTAVEFVLKLVEIFYGKAKAGSMANIMAARKN